MLGIVCWAAVTPVGHAAPNYAAKAITPSYVALSAPYGHPGAVPAIAWPRAVVVPYVAPVVAVATETPMAAAYAPGPGAPDPALMAAAEAKYGLPTGILHAIAIKESSDGRQACGNNPFGYASCHITFGSQAEAIGTVAADLASIGGDAAHMLCVYNAGATGCAEGLADGYVREGLALMP